MHRLKKRVLFLYISFSSGHQRAAEAVMHALKQMSPRVSPQGVDSFSYAFPVVGRLIARMYLEVLKYTPQLWDFLYDNPTVVEATREVRQTFNALNTGKICALLKRYHPRALICTQAMPATIISALKQKGRIKIPVIGIVTDYGVHSYWLSRHIDLYLVGTEEIKRKMILHGIKESRIKVTGIPVDPHFLSHGDKRAERISLGLDPDKPVILATGGSRGLGPLEEVVCSLRRALPDAQVIAVCGYNRGARANLEARFADDRHVRVFGHTSEMPKLMDASDLMISKPGGLTCAESMAKGLPLLMIRPLPGQEDRNARYMLRHDAAEKVESIPHMIERTRHLLHEKKRLADLSMKACEIAKPFAAFEAAEAILGLIGEPATAWRTHEKCRAGHSPTAHNVLTETTSNESRMPLPA